MIVKKPEGEDSILEVESKRKNDSDVRMPERFTIK